MARPCGRGADGAPGGGGADGISVGVLHEKPKRELDPVTETTIQVGTPGAGGKGGLGGAASAGIPSSSEFVFLRPDRRGPPATARRKACCRCTYNSEGPSARTPDVTATRTLRLPSSA